ncbi:MAG: NADP-dependent oxidoreductase domain-containing protein, partial [Olpidium bornovanus]
MQSIRQISPNGWFHPTVFTAFNFCIDKGMCFYWGTSEWGAWQIDSARRVAADLKLVGPVVEQPQYNCFHRERVEKEYDNFYKSDLGLGTTTWSPLDSGVLTGKYNNGIPDGTRLAMDDSLMKRIRSQVESEEGKIKIEKVRKMTKVAERLGCTVAQLALAW